MGPAVLFLVCLEAAHKTFLYLLLATGRAISNFARNWKYCSSVCWVKPVPTNSICKTDVIINTNTEYQVLLIHKTTTKPKLFLLEFKLLV